MPRAKHAAAPPVVDAHTDGLVTGTGLGNARRSARTGVAPTSGSFASVWSDLGGALERGWDATTQAVRAGGTAIKDTASTAVTKVDQAITLAPALWGDLDLADAAAMDPALANSLDFDRSDAKANKLDYDFLGADTVRIDALRLASARLFGLTTGAIVADGIRLTEQRGTASQQRATLHIPEAEAAQVAQLDPALRAEGITVSEVEVSRSFRRDGFWAEGFFAAAGPTSVTVGGVAIEGLDGAMSGDLSARDLSAATTASGTTAAAAMITGTPLSAGDLTAATLDARGVTLAQQGGTTTATADTLAGTDLGVAGASIAEGRLQGLTATAGPQGISGAATEATLRGMQAEDATVAQVTASTLSAASTAEGLSAGAGSLSAQDIAAGGASVGRVDLLDLTATDLLGQAGLSASSLTASQLAVAVPGLEARASGLSAADLEGALGDQATLSASNLDVSELAASSWARATPSVDPRLVNQLIALVQDVTARGTVALGGSTGSGLSAITFQPGTRALVELTVRGGRLVPGGTRVTLDKRAEAFAWTALKGVFVTADGRVLADVAGWFDQDVGKQLDLPNDRLPLQLNALASLATSTASASNKASNTDFTKVVGDTQGQASLTLGAGTVNTGTAQATLAAGNRATVTQSTGSGEAKLGVSFTRLVLSALGLKQGAGTVNLSGVTASNAQASSVTKGRTTRTDVSASRLTAASATARR